MDAVGRLQEPGDDDYTVPADEDEVTLQVAAAPETVGSVLDQILQRADFGERLRGARLEQRWADIVGEDLARHCTPVRLAGRILVLRAESQTWATQLRYLTGEIRQRIEDELGEGRIDQIRIVR